MTSSIRRLYRSIIHNIAFIPTLTALLFIAAAIVMLYFENQGLSGWFERNLPLLIITSADTARAILSTLIGALITLTVFSFSMVMIVLNQAANNFSPRLLPGLIRDRPHQVVLGVYLGVITFCMLTLISILPDSDYYTLPSFTVFLCVLMGVLCMGLFVYFIQSISNRVQIDDIIANIHRNTRAQIARQYELPKGYGSQSVEVTADWTVINAPHSGYVGFTNVEALSRQAEQLGGAIYLSVAKGMYALQGLPLVHTKEKPTDEQRQAILKAIDLAEEIPADWFENGLKNLTEVAVKAMSPGINDPGTALKAIDYLTDLLAEFLKLPRLSSYTNSKGGRFFFDHVHFSDFLRGVMEPLRQYTKHDTLLVRKLLVMLYHLLQQDRADENQRRAILLEIEALLEDANANISNELDRNEITKLVRSIRAQLTRAEAERLSPYQ